MSSRVRRHSLIAELLTTGSVLSQEELRQLLAERGIEVTQATLSRDLRDMAVLKGPRGYTLPAWQTGAPIGPQDGSMSSDLVGKSTLRRFVVHVAQAGTLVVLRTGVGQAALVALEFDRHPMPGVVGTIAGDDTVFIACPSVSDASSLTRRIAEAVGIGAEAAS